MRLSWYLIISAKPGLNPVAQISLTHGGPSAPPYEPHPCPCSKGLIRNRWEIAFQRDPLSRPGKRLREILIHARRSQHRKPNPNATNRP